MLCRGERGDISPSVCRAYISSRAYEQNMKPGGAHGRAGDAVQINRIDDPDAFAAAPCAEFSQGAL